MGDIAIREERPAALATSAAVEAERAIAEVKGAIAIAKSFPRDVRAARDRITQACERPALAEVAQYAYPRGGETVTGPSIRLAEAIAQNWGNFQFGIRELSNKDGQTVLEAYAWDVETNTRAVKVFSVAHERHTRQGVKALTDPRDVYELGANQAARRLRACILALIPGDIVEDAVAQCELTQQNALGAPADALKNLIAAFKPLEVTPKMLEARLGHALEATVMAEILGLRKLYQGIKDGFTTVADAFPQPAAPEKPDLKDRVAAQAAAARGGQS